MQKIVFLVIVFIFFAVNIVYSQIMDSSKKPISFNYDSDMKSLTLDTKLSTKIMPSFNIDSLLIEDVANNGVELGDMQARLLQKIEELTLYIIELKKENEEIKKMINTKKE